MHPAVLADLRARSAPTRTVVGFFDSLPAWGAAVAGVTTRGLEPAVFGRDRGIARPG